MWKALTSVFRHKLHIAYLFVCLVLGLGMLPGSAVFAQQDSEPTVVTAVAPEWPSHDSDAKTPRDAEVLVKVELDGFGNVVHSDLLTPKSAYSDSAIHAAELWKFGEPEGSGPDVKILNYMTVTLKFAFRLLPAKASDGEVGTTFVPPYEIDLARRMEQ